MSCVSVQLLADRSTFLSAFSSNARWLANLLTTSMTKDPIGSGQSKYIDKGLITDLVRDNNHRGAVGGLWNEIGSLQYKTLLDCGLAHNHFLLDAGCGSLRLGHKIVSYLEPGHYYGFDYNASLIEAGYDKELDGSARVRLPRENLIEHDVTMSVPFAQRFDVILCFSLFTHLPVGQVVAGLANLSSALRPGGKILSTFFISTTNPSEPCKQAGGIFSYAESDPYHVSIDFLQEQAASNSLALKEVTSFEHPRGQRLFEFSHDAGGHRLKETQAVQTDSRTIGSAADSPLLILGMHRSGTSLLAGTLESLGLVTGPVNTTAPHNKRGNREHEAIRGLNDAILAHNGFDWKSVTRSCGLLEWTDDHIRRAHDLVAPLQAEKGVWGFKDPRTLWTLDFWHSLFPNARHIGVFRSPQNVAASLAARGGDLHVPESEGLEMWLRTNERLLAVSQKLDMPLIHFDTQDIGSAFEQPVRRLAKRLGLDDSRPDFFSPSLVNQAEMPEALPPEVVSLYASLKARAALFAA